MKKETSLVLALDCSAQGFGLTLVCYAVVCEIQNYNIFAIYRMVEKFCYQLKAVV